MKSPRLSPDGRRGASPSRKTPHRQRLPGVGCFHDRANRPEHEVEHEHEYEFEVEPEYEHEHEFEVEVEVEPEYEYEYEYEVDAKHPTSSVCRGWGVLMIGRVPEARVYGE
ncbi:hypothetical protein [Lujinxingia litoralis]|uniref:hypothetical protein n=1 Tax=Lujinxingia litoralis TaxID=2211119 RepID=UPI0013140D23|nr:hypothetical protein [Lujinxingia litoralis]